MAAHLNVNGVSVHLGGQQVLEQLSFTVEPGQLLGIIGPNGAGKSTLFRVILGIQPPQTGSVRLVSDDGREGAVSLIGYVPQARLIDPEIPIEVRDFVSLGLPHKYRPWLNRMDKARVAELLEMTGTGHLAHQSLGRLSGGERQRVYLAQALARNPQILLLDEPTSNLDPGAQEKIAAVVHTICRQRGVSVLFISHDVNLIAQYADRILYLTKGHYAIGTVAEVIRPEVLSRLYGTPVRVGTDGTKLVVTTEGQAAGAICYHGDPLPTA